MASIVSAGTTSATALNMSADTTGILQLASNNGTTAVTVGTDQSVTMVGTATATKLIPTGTSVTGNGMYLPAANSVGISTAGVNAVYIDSSQNVGVGTSAPTYKMDVLGGAIRVKATSTNDGVVYVDNSNASNASIINFGTNGTLGAMQLVYGGSTYSVLGGANSLNFYNTTAGATVFYSSSTERMRIDSSGSLLVGNTTSLIGSMGSIQAVGPTTNRGYLSVGRTTAATTGVCGSLVAWNATNSIASFDFQANGANNSGLIQAYTWSAGSAVQGPYVSTGGTSWTTASDETLKDIIAPIEDATSKLSGLRTVFGKYKTDHDDVRRIFLIAQDVQAVLPEAISTDGNGKLGLNYQDLIPVLVKAIQEQQALITQLQADVAALKGAA